jgi:putative membrane protein
VLGLALVSPLHTVGEAVFPVHMAQHEVMMLLAAPLLVLGRPFVWGVPCLAIHLAALWTWHVP